MSLARDIADLGAVTARLDTVGGASGALSNRNLIINGAMQVAQRGTSSTGLGTASAYYTVDRFKISMGATTAGRFTMSQDSSAPSGFANSVKFECTTADTSIAAGEYLIMQHNLEGQDVQRFAKGTSDAKEFTLSFYVKGNASATYVAALFDGDNARYVAKTFSVTTDWTRIEITYPADTTGAFGDDNGSSLELWIWLHAGSTYTSGTLPATWASYSNANNAVGAGSFFDSTSRTFFITGVQLEVGDTATDFEHRTFADELQRCLRYFYSCGDGSSHPYQSFAYGSATAASGVETLLEFPVIMRTIPSITQVGNVHIGNGVVGHTFTGIALSTNQSGTKRATITLSGASGMTQFRAYRVEANNDATARLQFSAEL